MGRVSGWFIEALVKWRGYLLSQFLVAGIAGVGYSIRSITTLSNHIILYLLAVVVTAVRWGRGPAIVTAISSTLVFDYFFVPPYQPFGPWEPRYLWTLISLLVVGLIISTLTGRLRLRTDTAQQRELEMTALYQFSRDLAAENQVERVAEVCARHLWRILECEVAVFLDAPEGLAIRYVTPGLALSEDDRANATRAYDAECSADLHGLDRWSKDLQYLLLKTPGGKVGVLGFGACTRARACLGAEPVSWRRWSVKRLWPSDARSCRRRKGRPPCSRSGSSCRRRCSIPSRTICGRRSPPSPGL